MTYYQQEMLKIRDKYFPRPYQISKIIQARYFIDNCSPDNSSLDDIARNSHLSKFHLIRLFSRCYGRTPHQYLTDVKIAKAKKMLLTGEGVADTRQQLDFESTTTFAGLFKKYTGCSPSVYRQKSNFEEPVFYIYSELYTHKK